MEETQKQYYKYCIVPLCPSTTFKTPNKLFIRVPQDKSRRSKWLKACRRNQKDISEKTTAHVCEDHFNLEEDMDNYVKFKLMGGLKKMKTKVVPHIFTEFTRSNDFSSADNDELVKFNKPDYFDEIGNLVDSSEWKIKYEEMNIKEEDPEKNTARSNDFFSADNEELVKFNKPDSFDEIGNLVDSSEWKIKYEEMNIKEEDPEKNTASSDCFDQVEQEANITHKCCETSSDKLNCNNPICHVKPDGGCTSKCARSSTNPEEAYIFKCDQCNYKTSRKKYLKTHSLRHRNPEEIVRFKCDQCAYITFRKGNLLKHLRRHENSDEVKKFKCDQCDYKTFEKGHLQRHLRTHTTYKVVNKFKCDKCDYSATQKRYLNIHLITHQNPEEVNIFKCDQCSYGTFRNGNLKKHLLRHQNADEVKKFKCDQCNYKTFQKAHFQRHLLRHKDPEEVNEFKCDQCSYKTFRKCNLQRHSLHHKDSDKVNALQDNNAA